MSQPLNLPAADAPPSPPLGASVGAGPLLPGGDPDRPPLLHITVRGLPVGQGNIRYNAHGAGYHANAGRLRPWRAVVADTAAAAMASRPLIDAAVGLDAVFTLPRPKSHSRTGRNAHLLRDAAPMFPLGAPDLSHLVRAAEDALTGVVLVDDARIVDYGTVGKRYPHCGVDALPWPGAVIRVWAVEP